MTTVPRIHAEFIKAWAEGYDIEAYNPERDAWIICPEPGWFADIEYRVRPGEMEKPKKALFACYDVRVELDPFDDDLVDVYNHHDHFNLRLMFRDETLVQASLIDEDGNEDDEDYLPW
jgi:hypothetical protein